MEIEKQQNRETLISREAEEEPVSPTLYSDKNVMYGYPCHPKYLDFLKYYFNLTPIVDFVWELRDRKGTTRVLDLGSGIGAEGNVLMHNLPEAEVLTMDISTDGCRKGRHDFLMEQVQADANFLPFADGTFDGIHCKDMLVHIPDKMEFMRNVARILAPNGLFLLISSEISYPGFTQYEWNQQEIIDIGEMCGLELISQETVEMEHEDWYSHHNKRVFLTFRKR